MVHKHEHVTTIVNCPGTPPKTPPPSRPPPLVRDQDVMDIVIFRTIFFELFSFLHVHAPYHPFRLLMNLGIHQRQDKALLFVRPIDNGTQSQDTTVINCPGTPPKIPPPLRPQPPVRE